MSKASAFPVVFASLVGLLLVGGPAAASGAPDPANNDVATPPGGSAETSATDQVGATRDRLDQTPDAAPTPPPPAAVPAPVSESPPAAGKGEAGPVEPVPNPSAPPTLTWYGVTLYGVIDVGFAYLSHGAPPSSTYGPGLPYIVQSYSNRPLASVAGNGLSQSRLGLSGVEPLGLLDLRALFKLETGFQPTSGRLTDGPRSLLDNNGRANGDKVTAGDSARAGQPFQGAALGGVGSARLGSLTFGRQSSLMADDLLKYDPQLQSQAFSPLGYSGTAGGLGATEDKILDDSLKCVLGYGPVHLAALYQFGNGGRLPGGSESVGVGVDAAGLSIGILWGRVHGAVAVASLTAAQAAAAPGTLAATVADNTAYALMGRYAIARLKLYAGYEHMTYANPRDPLPNGTSTIGGYVLSTVNNTAFTVQKVLQYAWVGARYSPTPALDVTGAYYQFRQNSYSPDGCSDRSAASCSGLYHDASLVADYKLWLRFDAYTGINYSRAVAGLAAGFLNDHNWTSMTGIRFTF